MAFIIKLKAGHPAGTMQRAGIRVGRNAPIIMDKVPDAIKKDVWFTTAVVNKKEAKKLIKKGAVDLRVKKADENPEVDENPEATENPEVDE